MKAIYLGPTTGVTLDGNELILLKGHEVELPDNYSESSYINTLVSLGYLKLLEVGKKSKKEVSDAS